MTVRDVDLSRAISTALRHRPWLYELELDEAGWAPVDQLVSGLRGRGGDWGRVDRASIARMVAAADTRRFELDGDRIRALYGHSVTARIARTPGTPPERLFHGTSPATASLIAAQGLRPMGRQYVHLSVDRPTARAVGSRKSARPVVLVVEAAAAAAQGVAFYEGNEVIWLADLVPARFIAGDGQSGAAR